MRGAQTILVVLYARDSVEPPRVEPRLFELIMRKKPVSVRAHAKGGVTTVHAMDREEWEEIERARATVQDIGMARIVSLSPADYVEFPWKNGRGVTTDIAAAYKDGAKTRDWTEMLWRFGRTPILENGPYSDLTGLERLQVLVAGNGFTIHTQDGAVHRDLSRPFAPVRFDGATPLTGRLIDGPVESVNFLYRRDRFSGDLKAPEPGTKLALAAGTHLIYAPAGEATVELDGTAHALADRHALRIEGAAAFVARAGRVLVASLLVEG